jgi:hypothetical protein
VLRGEQQVPTCEVCGRDLPALLVRRDRDFYHNRRRLDELDQAANGQKEM